MSASVFPAALGLADRLGLLLHDLAQATPVGRHHRAIQQDFSFFFGRPARCKEGGLSAVVG